ncbi:hypothetical protein CDAR_382121 [Caerostris darwini]|uniref:Uncharacterized protein n=1 Tax=Caerostris darwini TaxID=1538125 RepID=A0AAV4WPU0_9ARAC|nr:hypothetical protein CDAR_382121 [Caerostris darwini]
MRLRYLSQDFLLQNHCPVMGHHQIKWQKSQHDFTRDNQQSARLATSQRTSSTPNSRRSVSQGELNIFVDILF